MPLLDRLFPGRLKSYIKTSLDEIHNQAKEEVNRQNLKPATAALWESMCDSTYEIMSQMLVDNSDKRLEWGLRSNRHKLNQVLLAVMYWWFLMYQFVLFNHKGIDGFPKDEELPELCDASNEFIKHLAQPSNLDFEVPGPWEERWKNQVSLEASLGLYNRVMEMLGLGVDLDQRVYRVSLFTTASESLYDTMVRDRLANGRGGG